MGSDKFIHPSKALPQSRYRTFASPQKIPWCCFPVNPSTPALGNHWSAFCCCRSDLSLLRFHRNEIIQHIPFCVPARLLSGSMMVLRSTPVMCGAVLLPVFMAD